MKSKQDQLWSCFRWSITQKHDRDGTRFQPLRQNRVLKTEQINQKAPNVSVTLAKIVTIHVHHTSFQHDVIILIVILIPTTLNLKRWHG